MLAGVGTLLDAGMPMAAVMLLDADKLLDAGCWCWAAVAMLRKNGAQSADGSIPYSLRAHLADVELAVGLPGEPGGANGDRR